jgi:hypothetical protein
MYDPDRDLYAVLGVPAGAFHAEVRSAIVRQYATLAVRDLAEASRMLLSPTRRVHYDLHRFLHRAGVLAGRIWQWVRRAQPVREPGWWRQESGSSARLGR